MNAEEEHLVSVSESNYKYQYYRSSLQHTHKLFCTCVVSLKG
jgi:hypothetical protein